MLPNIEDEQARLVMFENGELDLMSIDTETYEAALDPGHPFNPLLYVSPYGGLWFIKMKIDMAPLDDLLVRKALAHGQDMEKHRQRHLGPHRDPCQGSDIEPDPVPRPGRRLISRTIRTSRCSSLSDSSYGSGSDLPLLMIDLRRPGMIAMGVAMKEYWKDNLDVELEHPQARERRVAGVRASQFWRASQGSWIPDPMQIVRPP